MYIIVFITIWEQYQGCNKTEIMVHLGTFTLMKKIQKIFVEHILHADQ